MIENIKSFRDFLAHLYYQNPDFKVIWRNYSNSLGEVESTNERMAEIIENVMWEEKKVVNG